MGTKVMFESEEMVRADLFESVRTIAVDSEQLGKSDLFARRGGKGWEDSN